MTVTRENPVVLRQDMPSEVAVPDDGALTKIGRRAKSTLFGLCWIVVGGSVITYGSALVYANVARVEADSAIVTGTVEAVQAPAAGNLVSMNLRPGAVLSHGDRLFAIHNPEVEERISLSSVRVERARSDLTLKQAERDAERWRRDSFMLSVNADLDRSKAEIAALEEFNQSAQRRLETTNDLYTKGFVTRIRLEDVTDRAAEVRSNLARARASLAEKTALLTQVAAGRGYGGQGGLGRLDDSEAAVRRAESEVKLAVEELRAVMERRAVAKVSTSTEGRVLRVLKLEGSSVQPGDTIALIERNEDRVVYAFLTQSEVGRVSIGDEADVFLPAQRLNTRARVVAVERSGAYLDDVESRYIWRNARDSGVRQTDRDRTARVTLQLTSQDQAVARRSVSPGTPAVVSFERRWDGSQMMTAYRTFQQFATKTSERLASVSGLSSSAATSSRE